MMNIKRRTFIKNTAAASLLVPFTANSLHTLNSRTQNKALQVHLFSKHLQFLSIKEASQIAAEMGFVGLDLTVRPKGHVLPENVETHLPKAIEAIKSFGISCELITTEIGDVENLYDVKVIKTAAENGVKFYRSDWFKYLDGKTMQESLSFYQEKIKELSKVNKQYGIVGCYQNHAGTKIGASYWEVKQLLEKADPNYFGSQYDIRHAMADSGLSWSNGVKLLQKTMKTIVLKDFKWGQVNGKWKLINVPIGEGMVNFISYFRLLKSYGLQPPVSLHLEYPLGGVEKGKQELTVDKKVVFDAMRKDLTTIHKLWQSA